MNITFVSYAFSKFKYAFFSPVQKIGENEFLEKIYIYFVNQFLYEIFNI